MMKILFILLITFNFCQAQNCQTDSTGLIPINDLLNGSFMGRQGGLYFGSNNKPSSHSANLVSAIQRIKPLDLNGLPDSNQGKIVLLSIGASNPKTEFDNFKLKADTFRMINHKLKIVNGCQGGNGLQKIINPTDNYWNYVNNQLSSNGVSKSQVQVIWLEQENTQSSDYNFPSAPESLMQQFKQLFQLFFQFYPNLQVCYLTGRGYAGYIDNSSTAGNGLLQARDYYQGWAVKWLIENQISGDPTLAFNTPNKKAPLLDWSAYLWADGKNVRQDGLRWNCPVDVKPNDGLHWSPTGNEKAGKAIFEKFTSDAEARLWFLNNQTTSVNNYDSAVTINVYPNPTNGLIKIYTSLAHYEIQLIESGSGRIVSQSIQYGNVELYHNVSGIYILQIQVDGKQIIRKKLIILNQ